MPSERAIMTRGAFIAHLSDVISGFIGPAAVVSGDVELQSHLLALYGDMPLERILSDRVQPFLAREALGLANIYREHLAAPWVDLMAHPECVLVLERLTNDAL